MSSNLPPGVTDADIERAAGGGRSLLEEYELHLNEQGEQRRFEYDEKRGHMSPEDFQMLDHIYNYSAIPNLAEFVERALLWAYEQGGREYARGQELDRLFEGRS